jgi:hypothetical protein
VNNNAANPVINVRSYGEDPADVAVRFAFVEGAQRPASSPRQNISPDMATRPLIRIAACLKST